jgi:hypothetical protein
MMIVPIEAMVPASAFLAQLFHEIAPPVDYSLTPAWVLFVVSFVTLSLLGLAVWWIMRNLKRPVPPKLPRQKAIEALEQIAEQIEHIEPYQFSIQLSDILRGYVTEQYGLPVTRQTSVEFLEQLARKSPFSGGEKMLLEDFLNRCDLIKFARYEATSADSRLLLDEAIRFVKGGSVAVAA